MTDEEVTLVSIGFLALVWVAMLLIEAQNAGAISKIGRKGKRK